jgi:Cu2+-exporting ATPase
MCCRGCAAAAEAIRDLGLERFYRARTADAPRPVEPTEAELERLRVFDEPGLHRHFVASGTGRGRADLILERIACPACCWLIERRLQELPGVLAAQVDFTANRARVEWDATRLRLSGILRVITELGYGAQPYEAAAARAALDAERRLQLRRLALAGLFGMQVMMISVALYFGEWSGIEDAYRRFLQWIALLLTVPVIGYSAAPFFGNAWRDLSSLRVGMDVPVSLGLAIAFLGSVHATWSGAGQVYYDSVTMFVFLLLGGRFIEFNVRRGLAARLDWLHRIEPAVATRLEAGAGGADVERAVPAAALLPGDRILVRPGEMLPADGIVIEGETGIDESLISGESMPVRRGPGQQVIGGSSNVESPLKVRVQRVGDDTLLAVIRRLAERCQETKPALTEFANRVSAWFIAGVLALAGAAAWYWLRVDPGRWLPVTVSMLVITCPCALALAAPIVLTRAGAQLLARGAALTRSRALEALQRATDVVLDKTGTLTRGRPAIARVALLADLDEARCRALAAALEASSTHPLARAFRAPSRTAAAPQAGEGALAAASEVAAPPVLGELRNEAGQGVEARANGRLVRIGSRRFCEQIAGSPAPQSGAQVYLADEGRWLAAFFVEDALRPEAAEIVRSLAARGLRVHLVSGDEPALVARIARQLEIVSWTAGAAPQEKHDFVARLQAEGRVVAMVGDGLNDAPVLARADASVAMGAGADAALLQADVVLTADRLGALEDVLDAARGAMRLVRQNLGWALVYNAVALPAAALGWIGPWEAAIGMSASSFIVVLNALRPLAVNAGWKQASTSSSHSRSLSYS